MEVGLLSLAKRILDSKVTDFDPATFRDRYEEALLAHLKAKQAGIVPERKPMPRRIGWSISWRLCAAALPRTPNDPCRERQSWLLRLASGREPVRQHAATPPLAHNRDSTV